MNTDSILKDAVESPARSQLQGHRKTILTLREKGYSWRKVADFLNERGVMTDHTAVYRLVIGDRPYFEGDSGRILIGDVEYESRHGRPLHPYIAGLYVAIKKKGLAFLLDDLKGARPLWCECQFELSTVPNHDWLKQLGAELLADWNPNTPYHLDSRYGFELNFEGNLMALRCPIYNLEHFVPQVGEAVRTVTKFFAERKIDPAGRMKASNERKKRILSNLAKHPDETEDDLWEDYLKEYAEWTKSLEKQFEKIEI